MQLVAPRAGLRAILLVALLNGDRLVAKLRILRVQELLVMHARLDLGLQRVDLPPKRAHICTRVRARVRFHARGRTRARARAP